MKGGQSVNLTWLRLPAVLHVYLMGMSLLPALVVSLRTLPPPKLLAVAADFQVAWNVPVAT